MTVADFFLYLTFIVILFGGGIIVGLLIAKKEINKVLMKNGEIPYDYLSKDARETFQRIEDDLAKSIERNRKSIN